MAFALPRRVRPVSAVLRPVDSRTPCVDEIDVRLTCVFVANQHTDAKPESSPSVAAPVEPASLARRFGAVLIDCVLCALVARSFGDPLRDGWPPVVVLLAEYTFFIGLFAQTPGMRILKIRCVSVADGGAIGLFRALVRAVLFCLVIPVVIMDDRQRGLHDRAAGSMVVPAAEPSRAKTRG